MPPRFTIDDWQQQQQLADFDRLIVELRRWVDELPPWEPFDRARALWKRVEPRLGDLQVNLDRVLVVGVVGGTGVGKSTLLNALVGQRICEAGEVRRPTTVHPVVLHHPSVDPSFLQLDSSQTELHALAIPLLENMILVDCPDPDTQASDTVRPHNQAATGQDDSAATGQHNRDLLRRVLPLCDVLIHVGTAQKYKTEAVSAELLAHAPGRQAVFVQTHATTDADIRADWQQHLEAQGFEVPIVFRVDSEATLQAAERNTPPTGEFAELVDLLRTETAQRGRQRIRRASALDLIQWYLQNVHSECESKYPQIEELSAAIATQRAQLFNQVRGRLEDQLRDNRQMWRQRLLRQATQRWGWGPFAAFVRLTLSAGSLWPMLAMWRSRTLPGMMVAGGMAAGKAAFDQVRESLAGSAWLAADLGFSEADLIQAQSVLAGQAQRAGLDTRELLARPAAVPAALDTLARQLHERVERGIEKAVDLRARSRSGAFFHFLLELLFAILPALLLGRLAYNFFYEHNWQNKPIYGIEFLIQAILWIVVWGLLLRGLLSARLQRGLRRDISKMVDALGTEQTLGPIFADLASRCDSISREVDGIERLEHQAKKLSSEVLGENGTWQLGRLRGV
ncbi:MAG: ATP-binding cassette domain-containing protein [Planctomycetota bacterium]|nr:ATP-binding cassette domain-containing protein [Planctomycetota bacterium]